MDFLKIHYKSLTILGLILLFSFIILRKYYDSSLNATIEEPISITEIEEEITKITIDLKGEVKNPGVYTVDAGLLVQDIITLAGGLTEEADISRINLARPLINGEMLVIPSTATADTTPASGNESSKISLNNATVNELQTLPGIGPSKAAKIIAYRNTYGPFKAISEIQNVSGIGPSTYENIKDYLTL